jgi:hypothetical protein
MDIYQPQKEEVTKIESKGTNKTIMILIVLIIISAVTLGVLLANQQDDTTNTNNTEQVSGVQSVDEQTPPPSEKREDIPVPDITITQDQMKENSNLGSCWTIIDGAVYDITESLRRDGKFVSRELLDVCGKDGTKLIKEGVDGQPPLDRREPFGFYNSPQGKIEQ